MFKTRKYLVLQQIVDNTVSSVVEVREQEACGQPQFSGSNLGRCNFITITHIYCGFLLLFCCAIVVLNETIYNIECIVRVRIKSSGIPI